MVKIAIEICYWVLYYIVKEFEISKEFEWKYYIILNKYSKLYIY